MTMAMELIRHIAGQLRKQAAFYRAQAGFSYQRVYALEDENKALREEVAALRVVPRRNSDLNFYAAGWNACLDELARLNGKVVSEGLLRRIVAEPAGGAVYDAIAELRAMLDEGKES